MSFRFPSDEWIVELSRLLTEGPTYESSAKDWEGDFIFVVEPDESFFEAGCLPLGLRHGKSTGAALLAGAYAELGWDPDTGEPTAITISELGLTPYA